MDMNQIFEEVKNIAKEAGIFMMEGTIHAINAKSDIANIVTDMDVKTQSFIMDRLLPLIEDAVFFAEEKENQVLSDAYTWVIDPIDGTTNYAYDFHHSCVSIALVKDKKAIMGACYDPYLKELFYGQRGQGAFVNEIPLHVTKNDMKSSLIMCGTAPYQKECADVTFACMKDLFLHGRDIRRSGSAVLDLCYLAAGRVDAFYEDRLSFWDYGAASLFVEEAGGELYTMHGDWGKLTPIGMLAGNPCNMTDLKEIINSHQK